jgi:putative transposase
MLKTFKLRIYPTKKQISIMNSTLESCRELYNHLLEQRKIIWKNDKKSISYYSQSKYITEHKKHKEKLKNIHSQILMNVAMKIDLAFKSFFRRVKNKEKPGYPRFRGEGRCNSFTFPQSGFCIKGDKLKLSKIGLINIKQTRQLEGKIKTCTVKKSLTNKWYVSIVCELENLVKNSKLETKIGIDVGLESFATFSDGTKIDNPRFFRKEEKELSKAQRKLSKTEKKSLERIKRRKIVVRIYERINNKRTNFVHQESRRIVNKYDIICVEDLSINKMVQNKCFSKSISDAAWRGFTDCLSYKAEWAGKKLVKVNPAYTSQTCSACGYRESKKLYNRKHLCKCCGLELHRDHNAAINILTLGLQSLEQS